MLKQAVHLGIDLVVNYGPTFIQGERKLAGRLRRNADLAMRGTDTKSVL
jgi:hypothetical protein